MKLENLRNRLLLGLSAADMRLLGPHLKPVALQMRPHLEFRNRTVQNILFIDSGIVCVVASGATRKKIEVGIIGSEGVTGLSVILGADRSPNDTVVQVSGAGHSIPCETLLEAARQSPTLQRALLVYAHVFMIQIASTAMANGQGKIEQRVARWLLMAHDRLVSDELPLTHEFLATILCSNRPGVTLALSALQTRGLIKSSRGVITIVERLGLERLVGRSYGVAEAEYRRLL